ncbi:MAG: radical SAM family heme chaperone HemW [bacterium]|nr:radical SAM family heme chaperone HemW [bacterium]
MASPFSTSPKTRPVPPLSRAKAGTPLYVHLPFCAAKCHYCDFFSVPDEDQDVDGMSAAILREAERRAPRSPRTVFFGGGTPSLFTEGQLAHLLDRLDALTGWRASAREVTAECNPESLDEAKARALLRLGVRRVSLGVQSLDDATLARFGRVHTSAQALRAYDAARAAGLDHVNVDMIYAAPGQSPARWESELERVLALEPDHLSAYNLTFEPGTRFHLELQRGSIAGVPEEDELAMLDTTRAACARAGLEPYEISNYAGPGEACEHNVNYWNNGPYVGIGPSAVSKVGHARAGNVRGIASYLARIGADGNAAVWSEELGPVARLGETWWLGLRLARGVEPARARATAGFEGGADRDPALEVVASLERSGHVEREGDRVRLTPAGLPVADAVGRRFLGIGR